MLLIVKNLPANAGDAGSIPGSGRSPIKGYGNPLQYSCLGNLMNRGSWWVTVPGVTKSQTRLKPLSMYACFLCISFVEQVSGQLSSFFFFYLWWILSYIEMKQPRVYMCSPSQSPLPPPSPPVPSRFSQCTRSERLSHASNLGW